MTSTTASAIRPSLRDNRQLSGSPHTPSRFISSNYSSPGSSFRQEEDAVIIELDPRFVKAGFEGESGPQCSIQFSPQNSRRVGDYRIHLPTYKNTNRILEESSREYELWRNEVKDLDLDLVEDKLERAVREAYNKHLLTDAGTARLVLVLPSLVPLPVMSTILTLLFERWRYPSITLLPAPTMYAVAAGLRSALVVDIGWEESVITPIYEYREVAALRSTRAMKMLTFNVGDYLKSILRSQSDIADKGLRLDFDFVEDFIARCGSCCPYRDSLNNTLEDGVQAMVINASKEDAYKDEFHLDWPGHSCSHRTTISRSKLSQTVSQCFFGSPENQVYDDNEQCLDQLVYHSLLRLPPDVRALCMARIIVVGPGASIHGLKSLLLHKVSSVVNTYGWTAVRGQHVATKPPGSLESANVTFSAADASHDTALPLDKDYVGEKVWKQKNKERQDVEQGTLRLVDTLGAWAGASLTSSLKVKGMVEIERERYLNHGLSGASRDLDISVVPQRMSSMGAGQAKGSERASWSLGNWG